MGVELSNGYKGQALKRKPENKKQSISLTKYILMCLLKYYKFKKSTEHKHISQ